ncbi:MAG TPA: carbohydrate kinase family protein [Candidatus Blautia merdigallinarum]|uniref:Carbohydrate kinase family protein n=1 Tax=Candidatus Blautia merdigallinarum TaxID=2838495 RepID=A0A9D2N780_9FIRM|nr:carbohydrate kinase family protein [Candidatus Blautia merdigallinarum]
MGYDVWGLGTLAMDVLMKVDALPKEDGFCMVLDNERQPGGSGTNVIVQLARLGAKCGYSGAVGDDGLGQEVISSLEQENVNAENMVMKKGSITLHTDIVIDRNGSKFIMLNMGDAFGSLDAEEAALDQICKSKVFYTDLLPKNAALTALKEAKKAGVTTVFNLQVGLGTMEGLGVSKEEILESLAYVDIFAPCREGLYAITGTEDLDKCRDYLRKYCSGLLLFTLGDQGSAAYLGNEAKLTVPIKKVNTVDTTGAGDSYMGSFIYSYCLQGKELEDSMRFASVCAAHTCTGFGARFSPKLEEVADELE